MCKAFSPSLLLSPSLSLSLSLSDCAEDFFSDNGGGCIRCPDGSIRESGDPMTNCTCTGNLVTATEQTMTTSDICESEFHLCSLGTSIHVTCTVCI